MFQLKSFIQPMLGNADFESTPKLAYRFAGSAVMDRMKKRYWNFADTSESVENDCITFPAAPDQPAACPNVGRKRQWTRSGLTKGDRLCCGELGREQGIG